MTELEMAPLKKEEDEEEKVEIEKTADQLEEEAIRRWKMYHYPTWAPFMIWFLFLLCVINLVLTLDQWHGTHAHRNPVDLFPRNIRYGGWDFDNLRFAGCLLGLVSACFSFVLTPSADKFRFMFLLMFASSVCLAIAFGYDLSDLNEAVDMPYCNQINDIKTHKFICHFTRYRATVIFDILSAVFGGLVSFFMLYQALTGVVSRRQIFNERTGTMERVVLMPDDEYWMAFPPAFKKQRPIFNLAVLLVALCNAILLALSVTQSTGDLFMGPGQAEPHYNEGRSRPVDVFLIHSNEAIRYGSWNKFNFDMRLSTNALALIVLAFLIQWRRDGRFMQLMVLILLLGSAALFIVCFAYDYQDYNEQADKGCKYMNAENYKCVYHRYVALVIFDGFCGFLLLLFSTACLFTWVEQSMNPREVIEERKGLGWWCFGEWDLKKQQKKETKEIEKAETADEP